LRYVLRLTNSPIGSPLIAAQSRYAAYRSPDYMPDDRMLQ
jgi:hypothetical protein